MFLAQAQPARRLSGAGVALAAGILYLRGSKAATPASGCASTQPMSTDAGG